MIDYSFLMADFDFISLGIWKPKFVEDYQEIIFKIEFNLLGKQGICNVKKTYLIIIPFVKKIKEKFIINKMLIFILWKWKP